MSKSGETPEGLDALLNAIAERIEGGLALQKDARALRRMARQVSGYENGWTLRAHRQRGRPGDGAEGILRQFELAKSVDEYRRERGCSLNEAYLALGDKPTRGADTHKNAWKAMHRLIKMDAAEQQTELLRRCYAAEGLAIVVGSAGKK